MDTKEWQGLVDNGGTDIERKRWSSGWHALRPRLQAENVCFGGGKL